MSKIFGIGVDTVAVSRVLKACDKQHFLNKNFSMEEQLLFPQKKERVATNFAGKEAVVKAFGIGFRGILPSEIEVLRSENGAPYVKLSGNAKEFADEHKICKIHISLSDTKIDATAFVVVEQED